MPLRGTKLQHRDGRMQGLLTGMCPFMLLEPGVNGTLTVAHEFPLEFAVLGASSDVPPLGNGARIDLEQCRNLCGVCIHAES
jgi:hypothetical protein